MSIIESFAAFFGVLGTLLLASKSRLAGWGFVAFLASNAGWLYFSYGNGHHWMFAQQTAFTISSLAGIWVWLIQPVVGEYHFKDHVRLLCHRLNPVKKVATGRERGQRISNSELQIGQHRDESPVVKVVEVDAIKPLFRISKEKCHPVLETSVEHRGRVRDHGDHGVARPSELLKLVSDDQQLAAPPVAAGDLVLNTVAPPLPQQKQPSQDEGEHGAECLDPGCPLHARVTQEKIVHGCTSGGDRNAAGVAL